MKKIFGGKKKKQEDDVVGAIGNPSFPSATTGSESRSGGGARKGGTRVSPSASLSSAGSNIHYNIHATTSNSNHRYNLTSPSSIGEFGSPRSSTGPVDTDDEGIILADTDNVAEYYEKARNQTQEELRIAYEMSRAAQQKNTSNNKPSTLSLSTNSSDVDDSSSSAASPRLTSNQLKQWDRKTQQQQQQQQNRLSHQYSTSPTSSGGRSPSRQQRQQQQVAQPQRIYTMSSALPSQQKFNDVDDMNISESDASSFNLSTDAEDSEYENMKLNMRYPPGHLNSLGAGLTALDTSAIDTVGSITSYTTDEDRKIFPNLPTDDEMTLGTEASSKAGQLVPPSLLLQPLPNPMQQPNLTLPDQGRSRNTNSSSNNTSAESHHSATENIINMANHTSVNTSNDSSMISKSNLLHQKTLDPAWNDFVPDPVTVNPPTSTKSVSRNKPPGGTPRNFTTPKSKALSATNTTATTDFNDGFPKSMASSNTDFGNDGFPKSKGSANTDFSNDGFGMIRKGGGSSSSKNDGFGRSTATTTTAASTQSSKNNTLSSVDDTGFVDFGTFADFGEFPSTANIDKGGAEWATVEEKKDNSGWEVEEFFNTTTTSNSSSAKKNKSNAAKSNLNSSPSSSPFGNSNDFDDPAWNVSLSSPPAKTTPNTSTNNTSRENDPFYAASAVGSSYLSEGSSSAGPFTSPTKEDRSLTELLEAAKSKRKDRRSYGGNTTRHVSRLSTGSVNSAPAITSSYLRQHHNLGGGGNSSSNNGHRDMAGDDLRYGNSNAYSSSSSNNNNFITDRSGGDGTSVSDIISSLDAADRMKQRSEYPFTSHRSMGDAGVVATARAAKERLRERRRRERELAASRNPSIRHSASRDVHSDSDDSAENGKNSESWLFDQVTGAIGPVGIAADLESLSGRSNRSKNSHGAKSQRSSSVAGSRRRSSRKASSRRHRSDRSVDSHGSRTSRYSHRSTKSFLSQMSEQSRSVANDLLRLEMQLAMVGNNNANKDGAAGATAGDGMPVASNRMSSGASLGGGSRASARSGRKSTGGMRNNNNNHSSSSAVVRRSKVTIVAPPGKLGIILANKADSKGTVVSGVRTSSVLVDRISPGDRIVAIDGEDVSRMTVSEITTIMSRKAEYERRLTVMTASGPQMRSPTHSRSSPRAASVGGERDYVGGGELGGYAATTTTGSMSSYRRYDN